MNHARIAYIPVSCRWAVADVMLSTKKSKSAAAVNVAEENPNASLLKRSRLRMLRVPRGATTADGRPDYRRTEEQRSQVSAGPCSGIRCKTDAPPKKVKSLEENLQVSPSSARGMQHHRADRRRRAICGDAERRALLVDRGRSQQQL